MTKIEILGTGLELIKSGIRAFEPVLEESILQAGREIHVLSYLFTSNAAHILHLMEEAAAKGISITLVVNSLRSQDPLAKSILTSMAEKYPHVRILDFSGAGKKQLHAKIIVIDRKKALVGSANFSWGGMYSNYEIGLLIEGEPAWKLAEIVDCLATGIKERGSVE